jgi:peptidoglycan DL-endopeptidase CwlO
VATARLAYPSARKPLFRPISLIAAVAAAALAALAGPTIAGHAEPQMTISQAQARIAALNTQAEKITEAYDAAHEHLATLKREQGIAARELSANQAQLAKVQSTISKTANATYRTGGLNAYVLDAATDPQSFLDQATMLDALSRHQSEQFATAAAAGQAVDAATVAFHGKTAAVNATLQRISSEKSHIESLLAQARNLLSSLRAADRARLAAAAASTTAHQVSLRGSYNGPASGQAAVALRFAYAQLGKPYEYGAAGPYSYDCSGLTMAAWGAAGVGLPHNAAMQQSATRAVSSADAQPGDLVFFGSPAYHVGIYIGNGNMIAAPHTGDVVKIEAVYAGVSGYGRP